MVTTEHILRFSFPCVSYAHRIFLKVTMFTVCPIPLFYRLRAHVHSKSFPIPFVFFLKVTVFTTEYILRFYSIVEATDSNGERLYADSLAGRLRWAVTDFYSWVDLASIVPFYVDIVVAQDLPATQFIR